jgi:D-glutamate cyclase
MEVRKMDETMLSLGDSVDHLMKTDMKLPALPRGFIETIYQACRKVVGNPLCLSAADAIRTRVTKDSTVIISTGFVFPPYFPLGETDGPMGAVAIAYAIHHGIGARVVLITEKEVIDVLKATCTAAGLAVYNYEDFKYIPGAVHIKDFPYDIDQARQEGKRITDELKPSAVITVEKMGRNEKDIYHSARGNDMGKHIIKVDLLVEEANNRGILTIGIGDFGNEIGLGAVADTAKKAMGPLGIKCNCGCGGSTVTKVGTEIPIMSTISNWGAYGIAACLAFLLGKPNILHSPELEMRMTEASVRAGAMDGSLVSPTLSADGTTVDGSKAIVQLLHELIRIKSIKSRPFRK